MTTHAETPTQKAAARGHLIAVASGKGGVGKTWFSITLAHALAKAGQKVLLFDGDLGLANIDVQLGLMAKRDLNDVLEGHISLEKAVQTYYDGGFDILAGRSGQGTLSSLPPQKLSEIIVALRGLLKAYDAIIIDLGAGIDRTVRFIAAAAQTAYVVLNDEPTSLTDAYAFIKLSHNAGHSDNLQVVVNMADSHKAGEVTYETITKACDNFLKFHPPLAGIVRADKRVKDAIRAQTPYLTRNPNTDTATDIEKIAAQTIAQSKPAP